MTCSGCGKRFGGLSGFDRHRVGGRCRTAAELRKIGMHRDTKGVWRRAAPTNAQAVLVPDRGGHKFGRGHTEKTRKRRGAVGGPGGPETARSVDPATKGGEA